MAINKIQFNARHGLSVGTTPTSIVDASGNISTTGTLGASGTSTLAAINATSLSVTGATAFTLSPTAATPAQNDNSTKLATTAYYVGQAGVASPLMNGLANAGISLLFSKQDHIHPTDTTLAPKASPTFSTQITITGGTVAANTPPVSITQTWNNAPTTFSGILSNITDTASAANSKLIDLQVGGISKFNVDKSGNMTFAGNFITADTNIELGSVAVPTDVTANGGGITLHGTTDKTIIWDNTNSNWTSNQSLNLSSGLAYKINNVSILNATTLGTSVISSSLTSLGTIGTGIWQGTVISPTYGGTGVNNGAATLTSAANLTFAGAFAKTFTATGITTLTLPTTGTLATLAGVEALSNKTITLSAFNGTIGATTPSTISATTITASNGIAITGQISGTLGLGLNGAAGSVAGAINSVTSGSLAISGSTIAQWSTTGFAVNLKSSAQQLEAIGAVASYGTGGGVCIDTNNSPGMGYIRAYANSAGTGGTNIRVSLNGAVIGDFTTAGLIITGSLTTSGSILGSNLSGVNTGDNAANSSTTYIGTTAVALNRASAPLVLTGITSIDGSSASCTGNSATASNLSGTPALPNGTTATTQVATDNSTKLATTAFAVPRTAATGSAVLPSSTTANRDVAPGAGYFRFNTDLVKFEGYDGTAWGSVGGGATGGGGTGIFQENSTVMTTNYTLTTGKNASTVGPLTINTGITLTVPTGARLVVL